MARRSRYAVPGPRAGSVLLAGGRSGARRRDADGRGDQSAAARGLVAGGGCSACWCLARRWRVACSCGARSRAATGAPRGRGAVLERAWTRGDWAAMWQALTPRRGRRIREARFAAAYRSAERAAGVRWVHGREARRRSRWRDRGSPRRVGTAEFGTLRGTIVLPVSGSGNGVGVEWDPSLRLPGLRRRERVHTRVGSAPRRGAILAADGTPLDATALGASIAGQPAPRPTGLEAHL